MNSPEALRQALRTIEQTANESITQLLQQSVPVKIEDICTEYTLEIVRKQLLGLDELSKDSSRKAFNLALSAVFAFVQYTSSLVYCKTIKAVQGSLVY